MASEVVVGLDAGTTSAKAVVVDRDGAVVAEASSTPIVTHHPEPGAAEQDAGQVWSALCEASRGALAGTTGGDHRVTGVALASQSGSVVPVDQAGRAGPVITWMDTRSTAVVEGWTSETRELIRARSGWSPAPGLGLSTIAWLGTREPAAPTAARYASVDDFLVHELTGEWTTNPSNAAGLQLLDVSRLEWDQQLGDVAGVTPGQLSTIRPSGVRIGGVVVGAADATGIAPGTPLFAGGHDQACAALALGIVDPGQLVVSAGTAWVVTTVVGHGDVSRLPSSLNLGAHVVPARWLASTNLGGLGAMLDWWRGERGATSSQLTADLLAGMQPTDPVFVPARRDADHTAWGRFSPEERDPDPAACTRAVVEAAAFEVRAALAEMGSGRPSPPVTLVGGAAANRALIQLLADVTDTAVVVPDDSSWPARGAATLAADGLGWATGSVPLGELVVPDAAATARHAPRYEVYRRLSGGQP